MKTFEKEINWVTWEFDADKNETVETPHTKTATFNELNRTDKRQHELHFMLVDLFEGTAKANGEADIDSIGLNPKGLLKITVKAIEDLLTENESFTKADKEGFLNDSMALLPFGIWLIKEKFTPFFSNFKVN